MLLQKGVSELGGTGTTNALNVDWSGNATFGPSTDYLKYTEVDGLYRVTGSVTKWNLEAGGNATFTGNITAGNISDIKFKENITDANPQLNDVVALGNNLKNWDWKEEAPLNDELKAKRFLGLIAQEAEEISPGVTYEVNSGEDSYKAINHDILVMKLLGAVAELSAENAELRARVEALE